MVVGRSPQKQLWAQPPVLDVDALFRVVKSSADGPEVVSAVHIPLDVIADGLLRKALVAVRLCDFTSPVVGPLLVQFVVAVIGVEDIGKLAPGSLGMDELDFDGVEMRVVAVAGSS